MYQRIIARDLAHYHQANATLCTRSPVKEWLGTAGSTPLCKSWLHGSTPPPLPNAFPETNALLAHLTCPAPPAPINITITSADYKKFFGKWAESTSTSQDRHLGH
jgi:hypothetical protein